jgi:hypothetical protein
LARKRSVYLRLAKLSAALESAGWALRKVVFDGEERDARGSALAEIVAGSASFLVVQVANDREEMGWFEVGRWGGESEVVEVADWSINLSSMFRLK